MNATIIRFGYPATLIAEYDHWVVLLRPTAPTLGALVLAARGEAKAYGELPAAAFTEQGRIVVEIESALSAAVTPARINYMMLMMADPHVHFHIIPRYDGSRERDGVQYPDRGWPKLPDLAQAVTLDPRQIAEQVAWLQKLWSASAADGGRGKD